jgi:transcriptional regulator with XRE-family HTH domain
MKSHQSLRSVFGRNLRRLRVAQNLSQEKLAEHAGMHRTYVGSVERGERNVSIDAIQALAKALKVPVAEFFDGGPSK